jgi:hypothetical protein
LWENKLWHIAGTKTPSARLRKIYKTIMNLITWIAAVHIGSVSATTHNDFAKVQKK